jgi:hypothetical protein
VNALFYNEFEFKCMGFKQISVSRLLDPSKDLNHGGPRLFTDEFVDKLYDSEEEHRASIILSINEVAGLQTWAISLCENGEMPGTYTAFIYLEDFSKFDKVREIIGANSKYIVNGFVFNGNIGNYLNC